MLCLRFSLLWGELESTAQQKAVATTMLTEFLPYSGNDTYRCYPMFQSGFCIYFLLFFSCLYQGDKPSSCELHYAWKHDVYIIRNQWELSEDNLYKRQIKAYKDKQVPEWGWQLAINFVCLGLKKEDPSSDGSLYFKCDADIRTQIPTLALFMKPTSCWKTARVKTEESKRLGKRKKKTTSFAMHLSPAFPSTRQNADATAMALK